MIGDQEPDELSLEIAGKEFRFWADCEWTRHIDSFDTVQFVAPFDPESLQHRQLWQPLSYQEVKLKAGGKPAFAGYMMNVDPEVDAGERRVTIGAYAKAAVLGDHTMLAAKLPSEFDKLTLQQIANQVCDPFFLKPSFAFPAQPGSPFARVKLEPSDKVLDFLVELAKQRSVVIGNDADGNPVFRQSASGPQIPRAVLDGDAQPVVSVRPTFSPQNYYSEITGCAKPKSGRPGGKFTVHNRLGRGRFSRPFYCELDDTEPADVVAAVNARMGRMFGSAVVYEVELATTLDQQGELFRPDTFVSLKAPSAMIYRQTIFLVASVTIRRSAESRSCRLSLVLPGAYSGEQPASLPWAV